MLKINSHLIFISAFLLFALLSLNVTGENYAESDIPLRVGHNVGGLTVNILYCYSCGYKKAFDDYSGLIQQKYPDISVHGSNYDPPGVNMYLSRFVGIAKMLLIACVMSGFNIFAMLNKPQPTWWQWCIDNKMYSCMMLFFLCNIIEGQLVTSGAFEIFLNDMPVWSKLETGRIPQPPELFEIIANTQRLFNVDDTVKSGFVK